MVHEGSIAPALWLRRVYAYSIINTNRTSYAQECELKPAYFDSFEAMMKHAGIYDYVTRPVECAALLNLENDHGQSHDMALLSNLEYEILQLERTFMKMFSDRNWRVRNGIETVGQKYAWIATRHKGVGPMQARAILDDVTYTLKALALQEYADSLVSERFAPYREAA